MAAVRNDEEGIRALVVSLHLQSAIWGLRGMEDSMSWAGLREV